MTIKYVSRSETKAHEAAMQRVVEDERKEQDEINDKRKAAIGESNKKMKMAIDAADEKMRKAIEAAKKANNKAIQAAKKRADEKSRAAEEEAEKAAKRAQVNRESQLAAMKRYFEHLPLLRQVYHEAPHDVFELIVSKCCDDWVRGGLNAFRLANKRCKQVAESSATRLTNRLEEDGQDSLPIPIIQRCMRVNDIRCLSHTLRSLEGCPDGLKVLWIGNAPHLSDLSPLASCSMMTRLHIIGAPLLINLSPLASCSRMEVLMINNSFITDISVVSSMPLLKRLVCQKDLGSPSIKDLSPLSSCSRLERLCLYGNRELKDLSPLSACTGLERLEISDCPLITSLDPLSNLKHLKEIDCWGIDPHTSLLPIILCTGLKELNCDGEAVDLEELRRRRPDLKVNPPMP